MSKSAVANCWTCCCNQKAKIAVHSNLMASWIEEAQHCTTLFKDIAAISADYDISVLRYLNSFDAQNWWGISNTLG